MEKKNNSIQVKVNNGLIGIRDDQAALLGKEFMESIKTARYRVRDEANRITWVYDRLQGLCLE